MDRCAKFNRPENLSYWWDVSVGPCCILFLEKRPFGIWVVALEMVVDGRTAVTVLMRHRAACQNCPPSRRCDLMLFILLTTFSLFYLSPPLFHIILLPVFFWPAGYVTEEDIKNCTVEEHSVIDRLIDRGMWCLSISCHCPY